MCLEFRDVVECSGSLQVKRVGDTLVCELNNSLVMLKAESPCGCVLVYLHLLARGGVCLSV